MNNSDFNSNASVETEVPHRDFGDENKNVLINFNLDNNSQIIKKPTTIKHLKKVILIL